MPLKTILLMLAGAATVVPALSQSLGDVTYSGTWSIRKADSGKALPVTVQIRDFDGTWLGPIDVKAANGQAVACKRRKFPITVQESNINQFEFSVWGQAVDKSCPNLSFSLKPTGKNQFEGTSDEFGPVTLALKAGGRTKQ